MRSGGVAQGLFSLIPVTKVLRKIRPVCCLPVLCLVNICCQNCWEKLFFADATEKTLQKPCGEINCFSGEAKTLQKLGGEINGF